MRNISNILKDYRNKKGLTVEELSDRTKIRKVVIENLEAGNFEDFQELYLKAFIRSIAKELKILDSPDFIDAYKDFTEEFSKKSDIPKEVTEKDDVSVSTKPKIEKKKKVIRIDDEESSIVKLPEIATTSAFNPKNNVSKLFKSKPKLNSNVVIYTGIILFLLIILLITFWPVSDPYETEPPKMGTGKNSRTIEIGEDNSEKSLLDFFKQSDSLYLKVEVSDTVWFSMIIDKKIKVQTSLLPSQTYEWTGFQEFKITHGNAGKIKIYLNDKLLQPFAPPGYVAKDVIVTADKIINNNSQRVDSVRYNKKKKPKSEEPEFRFIEPSNLDEFDKNIKK